MSTETPAEIEAAVAPKLPRYINVEGRGMQTLIILGLWVVAGAAFVVSARSLYAIGTDWLGLEPAIALCLPLGIDMMAIVAAISRLRLRARGLGAVLPGLSLLVIALVSVAAQAVHAWSIRGVWTPETVTGVVISAAMPLTVLAASEIMVMVMAPPKLAKRGRSTRRVAPVPQKPAPAVQASAPVKPAVAKPAAAKVAAAPKPRPVPPVDLPERQPDEADLDYAIRLLDLGLVGQRRAAELSGTTRSKIETRLKQKAVEVAADQPVAA
ncbi:DUF2637 domain-containing protein [Leucobacter salsicius]|uniref:DUF2637 domain-containing protein n=1 Tax=Leucobacter salsicius TaxID=664638 RepID=UPI00034C2CD4|nr:DUF2637 domain-containing protein [Leucobacter salsicius]